MEYDVTIYFDSYDSENPRTASSLISDAFRDKGYTVTEQDTSGYVKAQAVQPLEIVSVTVASTAATTVINSIVTDIYNKLKDRFRKRLKDRFRRKSDQDDPVGLSIAIHDSDARALASIVIQDGKVILQFAEGGERVK